MPTIDKEIAFYEENKVKLEADHLGKWVLIRDCKIISIHQSFQEAAEEAVRKFGSGPYLIRQVGATPVALPTSVMYRI